MKKQQRTGIVIALLLLAICWLAGGTLRAAEYVIGPGDVLSISFFQARDLDAQVKVGLDGKISLDIVGQIEASGKTTTELQVDIARAMSRLNKEVSQATVRVMEYNYNYVYVIGQVNLPGKKTFEEIPDLWTIINESGGVGPAGDLTRVAILRGGKDAGKVEIVNVSEAIANAQLEKLPKIRRQDTIELPRTPGLVMGTELGMGAEKKPVVYVFGAVTTPGTISYERNLDVAEAIAMAGGTTVEANTKDIQLVIKDGYYSQTVNFDLAKYSKGGMPARYFVQKEDLIYVPVRGTGFFGAGIGGIATAVGALGTAVLLYDRIQGD